MQKRRDKPAAFLCALFFMRIFRILKERNHSLFFIFVARKKKSKQFPSISVPHVDLALPEQVQRSIWGSGFVALALIFILILFDNAGGAGNMIKKGAYAFVGELTPLLPIIFLVAGAVFLRLKTESKKPLFLAILLILASVSG